MKNLGDCLGICPDRVEFQKGRMIIYVRTPATEPQSA
jgi:hypothetical protein